MTEGQKLSRAFAEQYPGEAARVLEGLSESEVAAYLAELPAAVAAPVVAAMLPLAAAGVLGRMAPETGGAVVAVLGPERAASALRCLDRGSREALLARLRPGRRAALGLLMAYPEDTVGAWADPRTLALRRDATVAWARHAVAASVAPANCDLYVVDGDRRLRGWLPVGKLLRSDAAARLEQVMDPGPAVLPATAGVGEARGDGGWIGHASLPVVDGRGRLIGAVSAETLDRALGLGQERPAEAGSGALGTLVGTYLQAGVGLLQGLWGLLAPAADRGREEP